MYYNPVFWTVFFTSVRVLLRAFFSSSFKSNVRIFSTPSQPITVGTPIKYPSIPNSPSHSEAQGITRFLSLIKTVQEHKMQTLFQEV